MCIVEIFGTQDTFPNKGVERDFDGLIQKALIDLLEVIVIPFNQIQNLLRVGINYIKHDSDLVVLNSIHKHLLSSYPQCLRYIFFKCGNELIQAFIVALIEDIRELHIVFIFRVL